jgi:hypothetical protein
MTTNKQPTKADAERRVRSEREKRVLASLIDPQTAQAANATARKYGLEERHFTDGELRDAFISFELHGPQTFAGYVNKDSPACELSFDDPAELAAAVRQMIVDAWRAKISAGDFTLADLPKYEPEAKDEAVLIHGRGLEKGGSLFVVSTAGTGKSVMATQWSLCMAEGLPFAGLRPTRRLCPWIFQTEDSVTRLVIDRDDVTAELSETFPEIDWRQTWQKIRFIRFPGKTGADFIDALDGKLEAATNGKPDVLILNPLLAVVGGPVTDGNYITPFLRGGRIGGHDTNGLQYVLEKHNVGTIIFHHTPKPPQQEKEVEAWRKSPFPEYQAAGSSDLTNWGRTFITMMKTKDWPHVVCLTAGKNGSELGWEFIGGAHRHYMAWSRGKGVTGGNRHAWRELDPDELDAVTGETREKEQADVQRLVDLLKEKPLTWTQARNAKPGDMTTRQFDAAWRTIVAKPDQYGLAKAEVQTNAKRKPVYYGLPGAVETAADIALRNWKNARGEA